ncbi:MAG: hypothetical protein COA57_08705 [Flavobacteriales bacterium]|nr:MAG: hypothetical protein COA57_08705 [Flavobacteriales bacterium]
MNLEEVINWTNKNSGFLGLLLFAGSLIAGWTSGLFKSLIKKPKLKVRFIDKLSFYSFFYTGNKWFHKELNEEFELHKTGFVVYMAISNIGSAPTAIDKIWIGYKKNTIKNKLFRKNLNWLAQWHSVEPFRIELNNGSMIEIQNLRTKNNVLDNRDHNRIDLGSSIIGAAYFEQPEAWGSLNPQQDEQGLINVIVKIRDVYQRSYKFKTVLKQLPIEEARAYNEHFGSVEQLTVKEQKSG